MGRANNNVAWINGVPVHMYQEPVTRSKAAQDPCISWGDLYESIYDIVDGVSILRPGEEKFFGLTCNQVYWKRVAQLAAKGDMQAGKEIMDRIVGKPKQTIDTTTVQVTLQDYIAARIEINEAKGITFDADVQEIKPELDF